MIGYNLPSAKMGEKSIIKIADKFFTDAELNVLSVVALTLLFVLFVIMK